jgi:hypothetical protein
MALLLKSYKRYYLREDSSPQRSIRKGSHIKREKKEEGKRMDRYNKEYKIASETMKKREMRRRNRKYEDLFRFTLIVYI